MIVWEDGRHLPAARLDMRSLQIWKRVKPSELALDRQVDVQ